MATRAEAEREADARNLGESEGKKRWYASEEEGGQWVVFWRHTYKGRAANKSLDDLRTPN